MPILSREAGDMRSPEEKLAQLAQGVAECLRIIYGPDAELPTDPLEQLALLQDNAHQMATHRADTLQKDLQVVTNEASEKEKMKFWNEQQHMAEVEYDKIYSEVMKDMDSEERELLKTIRLPKEGSKLKIPYGDGKVWEIDIKAFESHSGTPIKLVHHVVRARRLLPYIHKFKQQGNELAALALSAELNETIGDDLTEEGMSPSIIRRAFNLPRGEFESILDNKMPEHAKREATENAIYAIKRAFSSYYANPSIPEHLPESVNDVEAFLAEVQALDGGPAFKNLPEEYRNRLINSIIFAIKDGELKIKIESGLV